MLPTSSVSATSPCLPPPPVGHLLTPPPHHHLLPSWTEHQHECKLHGGGWAANEGASTASVPSLPVDAPQPHGEPGGEPRPPRTQPQQTRYGRRGISLCVYVCRCQPACLPECYFPVVCRFTIFTNGESSIYAWTGFVAPGLADASCPKHYSVIGRSPHRTRLISCLGSAACSLLCERRLTRGFFCAERHASHAHRSLAP